MLGTKVLLFTALGLGGALFLLGGPAKAAKKPEGPVPEPEELPPRPSSKPVVVEEPIPERQGGSPELPRRGPGGTVLASDLPENCQLALYDAIAVGFDEPQASNWAECIAMYNLSPSEVYNNLFTAAYFEPV